MNEKVSFIGLKDIKLRYKQLEIKHKTSNDNFMDKKNIRISQKNKELDIKLQSQGKTVIHLAGLSRPLEKHEKNISESISLNIIGTCNLVMICQKLNIKLIITSLRAICLSIYYF